jgi:hypothetical protein
VQQGGTQRASGVLVFAGLHSRDAQVPYFPHGGAGGVVLNPNFTRVLCGYGTDGSTDYNKNNHCPDGISAHCVPGCGVSQDTPAWCDRAHPWNSNGLLCGFGWGSNGVGPWRPADICGDGGMLDWFAREGAPFPSHDEFAGYNEIIVESAPWAQHLPASVEAIFVIEGRHRGQGGNGVRDIHRRFLQTYGLERAAHPLLMFRPSNWVEPFVAVDG